MTKKRILIIITFILLFSLAFSFFIKVNLWDFDFWWHIATGKYIVSEGHLPEKDPFSFTSMMEENRSLFPERESFILKQYWLAQVIFYFIFDHAGPKGIIFLRAILLMLTLLIAFRWLQKSGVSFHFLFIAVFFLFNNLSRHTGERPVLFSILFTVVALFLLEDFRERKTRKLFLLVPLMLLWSNMHGGFIIGDIIIGVYMLGEGLKIISMKGKYTKQESTVFFYSTAVLAIGASYVNPTGWDAFLIAFSDKYDIFTEGIQEYSSPFFFYTEKIGSIDYVYLILAALFPAILIFRNKQLYSTHVLLLSGFLYMSLTARRYIIFYVIAATMLIVKEIDAVINTLIKKRVSERPYRKMEYAFVVAALCSTLFFMSGYLDYSRFNFGVEKGLTVPEGAVNFIEENRIEGNMFNDLPYGGYIAWRLYPGKKTFIDSRALNRNVMLEMDWIINTRDFDKNTDPSAQSVPLWEMLLNHYKINLIILSLSDVYGSVNFLIFKLLEEDKWVPVYNDAISIVFVRNTGKNRSVIERFRVSKENVYTLIIVRSSLDAMYNSINPRFLVSIGETFYRMGRLNDALTAYRYANKRMPENPAIMEKINQIEAEIKADKNHAE